MKKVLIILIVFALYASGPTGGGRTIQMGTFSGGGAPESDYRYSFSYKLTDNIGDGSKTSEDVSVSTSYKLHGGFRNVDRDLREPIVGLEVPDTISSSAIFYVSWSGIDTTMEDGPGWGVWKYDVQWSKSSDPGNWHNWHTGTELTNSWFGPGDPTDVKPDTIYYFRVRAYDLATNVSDYPGRANDSVSYNPPTIALEVDMNAGDSIWSLDTVEVEDVLSATEPDMYIIKNRGSEFIDIGLYSYNTMNWQLADEPGLDQYSLRAYINDSAFPPPESWYNDSSIVKAGYDNIKYASPSYFGPSGWNMAPVVADSILRTDNLWLQVQAPTTTSRFGGFDDEMILMKIEARTSVY